MHARGEDIDICLRCVVCGDDIYIYVCTKDGFHTYKLSVEWPWHGGKISISVKNFLDLIADRAFQVCDAMNVSTSAWNGLVLMCDVCAFVCVVRVAVLIICWLSVHVSAYDCSFLHGSRAIKSTCLYVLDATCILCVCRSKSAFTLDACQSYNMASVFVLRAVCGFADLASMGGRPMPGS